MAKRKSKVNPVDDRAIHGGPDLDELGPVVDAARDGPAYHEPPAVCTDPVPGSRLELAIEALGDILRCNTARKCHDRVHAALRELEK